MIRWSHVGLNCRDQAATEDYYTRWFGFDRARSFPIGEDREIVFLKKDDIYLELFPGASAVDPVSDPGDGPQDAGTARHLAFQTDDVDEVLVRMGEAAQVTLGPLSFDDAIPGWRTVWLADPDGVIVEVSQGYRDKD
jgi:glyoxylase I family protein